MGCQDHEHKHEGECKNSPDKKGMLDNIQEKIVSRKLLVFMTATALMWFGLDPDTWAMIAAMYIGGQSVIDVAKVWKGM
tara:strand:- start:88 stop:324 length:237 start_codon:yes stop_codon:yes gene_type:complete